MLRSGVAMWSCVVCILLLCLGMQDAVMVLQALLAAPACADSFAQLLLTDVTLSEMFQQLLEAQSGGVHDALQQQILARAAVYSLVSSYCRHCLMAVSCYNLLPSTCG